MHKEHEVAPRSRDERSIARTRRPAPPAPANLALALQRGAGNQAAGRVLSRFTDANKDRYGKAKGFLDEFHELIQAVLDAHKGTFVAKAGDRPALLAPLEAQAKLYGVTVQQWEAATEAAAEAPLIKTAMEQAKNAFALRDALYAALGGGDAEAGKVAVEKVLKARAAGRKTMEEQKQREAAFAAQKLADEKTRTDLAAVFVPAPAGAAYTRPADADLPRFAEHVRLSHSAFAGLSPDQLKSQYCPLYLLSAAQLARVQGFAGAMGLSDWKAQNLPASRAASFTFDRWLVPTKAQTLHFELGGEIFADWAVERHAHGFTVARIMEIWSFVLNNQKSPFMKITGDDDRKVYEYVPRDRTETKVVTVRNNAVLITCYDTGRR